MVRELASADAALRGPRGHQAPLPGTDLLRSSLRRPRESQKAVFPGFMPRRVE